MPPRKSFLESIKKGSPGSKTETDHPSHPTEDTGEPCDTDSGTPPPLEEKDTPLPGDTDVPMAPKDVPSVTPLGVETPGLFNATYRADASVTGRTVIIGNMAIKLPGPSVDILTTNNTATIQAFNLTEWPVTGTPKVLTQTVAPLGNPQQKNWRLKKKRFQRELPGNDNYYKYTWTGTTPRTVRINGLLMTLQPGDYLLGRTKYAYKEIEHMYGADLLNGRSSTFTRLAAVTIGAVADPTVAQLTTGITVTGTYAPVGTVTYAWTQVAGPTVVFTPSNALVTVVSRALTLAGSVITLKLTTTDKTLAGEFSTEATVTFTVLA